LLAPITTPSKREEATLPAIEEPKRQAVAS
jgi:hypothetical protein